MSRAGTMHEWYRFLDVRSDDEAVCELRRQSFRLDTIYSELEKVSRNLSYSPGGDIDGALSVARTSLSESIEMINDIATRFRAGEHQVA